MELSQYLRMMGTMYVQGARSDFHPRLLRRIGGSLAICARDAEHIRIDPDSWLGMRRTFDDTWTAARVGWRRHAAHIRQLLNAGNTPSQAIFIYCERFGTTPHLPVQLELAIQSATTASGREVPNWQSPTVELRARIVRSGEVMSDTFGAIATLSALIMTADDWQHATPEEWNQALSVGEVAVVVGAMASAHADARQQRQDTHASAESAR